MSFACSWSSGGAALVGAAGGAAAVGSGAGEFEPPPVPASAHSVVTIAGGGLGGAPAYEPPEGGELTVGAVGMGGVATTAPFMALIGGGLGGGAVAGGGLSGGALGALAGGALGALAAGGVAGAFGGARLASSEASPTTVSAAPASAAASVASSPEAASSVGLPSPPGSMLTVVMFGDASALGWFEAPSLPHPADNAAAHATAAAVSH